MDHEGDSFWCFKVGLEMIDNRFRVSLCVFLCFQYAQDLGRWRDSCLLHALQFKLFITYIFVFDSGWELDSNPGLTRVRQAAYY